MGIKFFIDVFLRKPWLLLAAYSFLIIILFLFKKLNKTERAVVLIVFVYAIHTLICSHLAIAKIETSWTYNILCMPLSWMIVLLFTQNLTKSKHVKTIKKIALIFILIHISNILFFQGIRYIATYTYLILQTINAVVSYYYLKDQMDNSDKHPSMNLLNWFAAATVIDHITSIPITATLSQDMIGFADRRYASFLYSIMSFVYGCWYLIIGAGIIWNKTALSSRFLSRSSP
jgi:hypothetical protein